MWSSPFLRAWSSAVVVENVQLQINHPTSPGLSFVTTNDQSCLSVVQLLLYLKRWIDLGLWGEAAARHSDKVCIELIKVCITRCLAHRLEQEKPSAWGNAAPITTLNNLPRKLCCLCQKLRIQTSRLVSLGEVRGPGVSQQNPYYADGVSEVLGGALCISLLMELEINLLIFSSTKLDRLRNEAHLLVKNFIRLLYSCVSLKNVTMSLLDFFFTMIIEIRNSVFYQNWRLKKTFKDLSVNIKTPKQEKQTGFI